MICKLIFAFLPSLASGVIEVNIQASKSVPGATVEVSGSHVKVIDETDRPLFYVTDKQLKKAIMNISHHKPDDVFVKSPTPWNDLYETYDWNQVEVNITAVHGHVLKRTDERVNVTIQGIINDSSSNVTFKAEMTGNIQDSVVNKWNVTNKGDNNEGIQYNIAFVGDNEDDVKIIEFASTWGVEKSTLQHLRVGSGSDITVIELETGSALVTTLTAVRTTLKVKIDYEASLKGDVVYNYAKKYKGHHFWRFPVQKLLTESGLPTVINFQEVMTAKFYYDATFVVRDTRSGKTLLSLPIALYQSYF